jgi:hypothetical protein
MLFGELEVFLGIPVGITVFLLVWVTVMLGQTANRVGRLQRMLDLLVKHAGINVMDIAVHEAQALVREGKKIEAIKVYRDYTGASLVDAKTVVERMQEGAGPA